MFLIRCFALLVCLALCQTASAQGGLSAYTPVAPTLDGVIGAAEWAPAATVDFTVAYCQEDHLVTMYLMNDSTNLYVALLIRDEDFPAAGFSDRFIVHVNNDGVGPRAVGDDTWIAEHDNNIVDDAHHPGGGPLQFASDIQAGGTNDLLAGVTFTAAPTGGIGDYMIEIARPLDTTDDAFDPSWVFGSLASLALSIEESNLPPACANVFPGNDPNNWIPIQIASPPGSCSPPFDLICQGSCADFAIDATWSNGSIYSEILFEVRELGTAGPPLVSDTLPGGATSHSANVPASGAYEVRVVGVCSSGVLVDAQCDVEVFPFPTITTNAVIRLEPPGGQIDSAAVISDTLGLIGRAPVNGGTLLGFDCRSEMVQGDIAWVSLGTFPNNHQLTFDEGQTLVDLHLSGVSIYLEGADHWGFDPVTPFRDYDGVLGTQADGNVIDDGDDSLVAFIGLQHDDLDLTGFDGIYEQDQPGNDFTDQLLPTGDPQFPTDLSGANAGAVMQATAGYSVSIYYVPPIPFGGGSGGSGKVQSSSYEFGGYCGDRQGKMMAMSGALKGFGLTSDFIRADCNTDGPIDVGDVLHLFNYLFSGAAPVDCEDACDSNDDEMLDVADGVYTLSYLFVSGPVPPTPFPDCGPDDPPTGPLECFFYPPCP